MIKLICIEFGNYTFFEAEVEGIKAVEPNEEGVIISDAYFDNWNYTDETIRGNLNDIIDYSIKEHNEVLRFDIDSGRHLNIYITCSRCGSRLVTIPSVEWQPQFDPIPLENELLENRQDFLQLRKERKDDNQLPVLWQP